MVGNMPEDALHRHRLKRTLFVSFTSSAQLYAPLPVPVALQLPTFPASLHEPRFYWRCCARIAQQQDASGKKGAPLFQGGAFLDAQAG